MVPCSRLEALIEPFYTKRGNGCTPMPLGTMLRRVAGLDAFEDVVPDESTILRFRHFLEQNELAVAIFAEINSVLNEKGLSKKRGSVVDATLIAVPSSTRNQDKWRDPDMSQTKKGNQWYFGMTSRRRRTPTGRSREAGCGHEQSEAAQMAHIGVDSEIGLIHTVECTTAKVADNVMLKDCLHGEESIVFADRGCHQNNRTIEHLQAKDGLAILMPTKKPKGGELTEQQKKSNRILSAIRAVVEHPFRVIKRQFGFTKVRYRGLKKNTGQIVTLFALSNLWMARHRLMPTTGEVRP